MPLSPKAFDTAAGLLLQARRSHVALTELPEDVHPATFADAYAIQDRVMQGFGDRVAGWKIGATAKAVQEKFGTSEPFAGPFFQATTFQSPAQTPAANYFHGAIESEFAFRFGSRLAPDRAGRPLAAILDAVDALVPAIEIVGPRFNDLLFGRGTTAVADCALNAGFVLGRPVTNWRQIDLISHKVRLDIDGQTVAEGTGAAVLGNPLDALAWAVRHLAGRDIAIEPGMVVSTGTTTGIVMLKPGQTAKADFGSLGAVELTFTA